MVDKVKNILLLLTAAVLATVVACEKYEDPKGEDIGDRLKDHYCNDPLAVNYNWGFPGIPDSSTCMYPVDAFMGTWQGVDSVYFQDLSFDTVILRQLVFGDTGDSLKSELVISGWCPQLILTATANRYFRADLDSTGGGIDGQLLCQPQDTITGYFYFLDSLRQELSFELKVKGASGVRIHKGLAQRS